MKLPTEQQIREHLDRLMTEAGGVLRIAIVSAEQMPALIEAANDGDPDARTMFDSVKQAIYGFYEAQQHNESRQCFACSKTLKLPHGIVVLSPVLSGKKQHGMAGLLCKACDALPAAEIGDRVTATLGDLGITCLRRINVHSREGHA